MLLEIPDAAHQRPRGGAGHRPSARAPALADAGGERHDGGVRQAAEALRRGPAARPGLPTVPELSTTLATKAFDGALGQLFLVTRALEYETRHDVRAAGELFSFTTPAELASYLSDVEAAYQSSSRRSGHRQQRETTSRCAMRSFASPPALVDNATGRSPAPARRVSSAAGRPPQPRPGRKPASRLHAVAGARRADLQRELLHRHPDGPAHQPGRVSAGRHAAGGGPPAAGSAYLRSCTDRGSGRRLSWSPNTASRTRSASGARSCRRG